MGNVARDHRQDNANQRLLPGIRQIIIKNIRHIIFKMTIGPLPARAFGVYWALKSHEALRAAGISAQQLAQDAESVLAKFPNAPVNADERRRLRAALYRPLLGVAKEDRGRLVDLVVAILLDSHSNAAS
jgi:hypothetical protein